MVRTRQPPDSSPPSYDAVVRATRNHSRETASLLPSARPTRRRHSSSRLQVSLVILSIFTAILVAVATGFLAVHIDRNLRAREIFKWRKTIDNYLAEESDLLDRIHKIQREISDGARRVEEQRKLNKELKKEWLGWQREKEERRRMRLYWADVKAAGRCLSHDTVEYTARLANLLPGVDELLACKTTPITIHGKVYESPDHCEVLGEDVIYGHWKATGEYKCKAYWEAGYEDKGCTAPGSETRRFRAKLGGVHSEQDWEALCYTTPVTILHQYFRHPLMCLDRGKDGKWGVWDVQDVLCD